MIKWYKNKEAFTEQWVDVDSLIDLKYTTKY